MSNGTKSRLREAGIRPSAQRLAIAEVVLQGEHHFTADEVHDAARRRVPAVSLATVYNSLHLFVERGLLREVRLDGERVLYDRNTGPHHHLVDSATGEIHDVPMERLQVAGLERLKNWQIEDVHIVLRAKRRDRRGHRRKRTEGIDRITP